MATVLTKALPGPQAPSGPVVLPDPHLEEIQAIQARMEALPTGMYTPEQIAQRRAQNQRMYQLGILGQLSGDEALSQVGGHVFKQALGQRQPHVTERGSLDPMTGQWAYNPEWQREQMQGRIDRLQQMRAAAQLQERAREDQQAHQKALAEQAAADRAALHQVTAGGAAATRAAAQDARTWTVEDRMADDFNRDVKHHQGVLNAYKALQSIASNPSAMSDVALIISYMKTLDPGSVVKETEAATIQNAAGVPEQVRNMYNRARSGERLNPAQRADIIGTAGRIAAESQKAYGEIVQQYQGRAKRRNLSAENITGVPIEEAPSSPGAPASQSGGKPVRVNY